MSEFIIIGASRGLGKALAEELASHGARVTATVRKERDLATFDGNVAIETVLLDLRDENAGAPLAHRFQAGAIDAIIVNAGSFGPDHQDVTQVSADEAASLFWTNAIAPVSLARRLLPLVRPGGVIGFLSSRTASISLNDEGDMELYRASKAALNSLSRSFAVAHALPANVGVLLLHPGWVQTDMGGSSAPVAVADSVRGLRSVIAESLDRPAHRYVDYQGDAIPW